MYRRPAAHARFVRPISVPVNVVAALLSGLVAIWLHAPGQIPYDGITVWYEATQAVHFSQHPPAFALIWRVADLIAGGPAGLSALQLICFWLPAFLVVHWTRPPALLAILFYGLLFAWPVFFANSSLLMKDVLGAHLLLLATVIGLLRPGRITGPQTMAALSLACLAALVRYQFAPVVLILLAAMVWKSRRDRAHAARLFVRGAASAFGTAAAAGLLVALVFTDTVRDTPDPPSALRKILVFDIAGAVSHAPATSVAVLERHGVDSAALKSKNTQLFTPYRVDTLWEPAGVFAILAGVSTGAVFQQWTEVVRNAPRAFLAHRSAAFARVLGLHDVYKCWPIYGGISAQPADLAHTVGASSHAPSLSAALIKHRLFPSGSFIFRPWIYALAAIGLVGLACLRRAPFAAGVLAASGLLYELTFLFFPQACDVRYSYFLMAATAFGAAIAAFAALRQSRLFAGHVQRLHAAIGY